MRNNLNRTIYGDKAIMPIRWHEPTVIYAPTSQARCIQVLVLAKRVGKGQCDFEMQHFSAQYGVDASGAIVIPGYHPDYEVFIKAALVQLPCKRYKNLPSVKEQCENNLREALMLRKNVVGISPTKAT